MVSGPFYIRRHPDPASAGFHPSMFPPLADIRSERRSRLTGVAMISFLLNAVQACFTRMATILTSAASSHRYVTDALSCLAPSLPYR